MNIHAGDGVSNTIYNAKMVQREVTVAIQRVTEYWSRGNVSEREIADRIAKHLSSIYALDFPPGN